MSQKKRSAEAAAVRAPGDELARDVPLAELHFEDPREDEFEAEIEWDEAAGVDEDADDEPMVANVDNSEAARDAAAREAARDAQPATSAASAGARRLCAHSPACRSPHLCVCRSATLAIVRVWPRVLQLPRWAPLRNPAQRRASFWRSGMRPKAS